MRNLARLFARRVIMSDEVISSRMGLPRYMSTVGMSMFLGAMTGYIVIGIAHEWKLVVVPGMLLLAFQLQVIDEIIEIEREKKR